MIEFDIDMEYCMDFDKLDSVILHDENGEMDDMVFVPERTCRIEGTYSDEYAIYDHLTCGHVNLRHWHEPTSYCSTCGRKVVE